jgi:hypothetical protein
MEEEHVGVYAVPHVRREGDAAPPPPCGVANGAAQTDIVFSAADAVVEAALGLRAAALIAEQAGDAAAAAHGKQRLHSAVVPAASTAALIAQRRVAAPSASDFLYPIRLAGLYRVLVAHDAAATVHEPFAAALATAVPMHAERITPAGSVAAEAEDRERARGCDVFGFAMHEGAVTVASNAVTLAPSAAAGAPSQRELPASPIPTTFNAQALSAQQHYLGEAGLLVFVLLAEQCVNATHIDLRDQYTSATPAVMKAVGRVLREHGSLRAVDLRGTFVELSELRGIVAAVRRNTRLTDVRVDDALCRTPASLRRALDAALALNNEIMASRTLRVTASLRPLPTERLQALARPYELHRQW